MTLFEIFFGVVMVVIGSYLTYMGIHMSNEKKAGHYIPLPWESKDKFDND